MRQLKPKTPYFGSILEETIVVRVTYRRRTDATKSCIQGQFSYRYPHSLVRSQEL